MKTHKFKLYVFFIIFSAHQLIQTKNCKYMQTRLKYNKTCIIIITKLEKRSLKNQRIVDWIYMLPKPLLKTQDEIEEIASQFAIQYNFNYKNTSLYALVKNMKGNIIHKISKFSLIVHDENEFDIYLSPYSSLSYDKVAIAQSIGHYVLHYQSQIIIHPDGFICKKNLNVDDKNELKIFQEAYWFQQELLLPRNEFIEFYTQHNINETAQEFSLSLRDVQMRAKSLGLLK